MATMVTAQLDEATRTEIRDACREVARQQLARGRAHLASAEALERLATSFFEAAMQAAACSAIYDPGVVARAARYLADVHAMLPHAEDTRWFSDMLRCLLELVSPNAITPFRHQAFLQDVEHGIAMSREDWRAEPNEEP